MALYTGVTGYVKNASTSIVHLGSWEVEMTTEIIEVVSFGNTYKEKVPSIKDWSASVDGAADFATASGQKALIDAFEAGTLLTFGFGISVTVYFTGTGYIESLKIKDEADGNVSLSMSVAGSGGIVLTGAVA